MKGWHFSLPPSLSLTSLMLSVSSSQPSSSINALDSSAPLEMVVVTPSMASGILERPARLLVPGAHVLRHPQDSDCDGFPSVMGLSSMTQLIVRKGTYSGEPNQITQFFLKKDFSQAGLCDVESEISIQGEESKHSLIFCSTYGKGSQEELKTPSPTASRKAETLTLPQIQNQ